MTTTQIDDHFLASAMIQHQLGLTGSAVEVLINGPLELEELPEYHYQLASYHVLFGETYAAYLCLQRAAELDPDIWEQARSKPLFATLHDRMPPEAPHPPREEVTAPADPSRLPREPNQIEFN